MYFDKKFKLKQSHSAYLPCFFFLGGGGGGGVWVSKVKKKFQLLTYPS